MRLKAYERLGGEPIVRDVSVVVIEDDAGQPIGVACNIGNGMTTVSHAGDPEFNRILHTLGINRTVITDTIDKQLSKPDKLPLILDNQ